MNAATGRALVAAIGLWTFQACDGDSPVERTAQVTQLAFITQPGTAEGQVAFDPVIRVALQDASGRTVTGASREVTVRLGASPAGATLRGTTTVTSVNGVATFADLSLALPGDGFRLEAQSPGLPAVLSNPFVVRLTFAQTGAGSVHSCGLTVAGYAYCWGGNPAGQLGDGTTTQRERPTPVSGNQRFAQISVGDHHTCGVITTGGTTTQRNVPTPVMAGLTVTAVRVGRIHSCGVTTGEIAYCWGNNFDGRLGDGTTMNRPTPTLVAGGLAFTQVHPGREHTCGITTANIAYCWGFNAQGQLGNGTTQSILSPARVVQ